MSKTEFKLWQNCIPGDNTEIPQITFYPPIRKTSDSAVIIFPGGGYSHRAAHEGEGYAQLINSFGISAFVVSYRVAPARFPCELLDARCAVRFVRTNSEKFGISKEKIAVMGSSAGGHLAALLSTYRKALDGEELHITDSNDYIPNAQILCYPVISSDESVSHIGSYLNLLGENYSEREAFDPELLVDNKTPPAFIWHTSDDSCVNVENSYRYASALNKHSISCEIHIFPHGPHGLGIASERPHIHQWTILLKNWLDYIDFIDVIK